MAVTDQDVAALHAKCAQLEAALVAMCDPQELHEVSLLVQGFQNAVQDVFTVVDALGVGTDAHYVGAVARLRRLPCYTGCCT